MKETFKINKLKKLGNKKDVWQAPFITLSL